MAKQFRRNIYEGQRAGSVRLLCLDGCCAHAYLGRRPVHVGHRGTSSEVLATGTGFDGVCVDEGVFHHRVSTGDMSRRAMLLPLGLLFVF